MVKKLKKVGTIFATLIGICSIGITIPFLASCSNNHYVTEGKPNPNIIIDETNTYVFNKTTNTLLKPTDDFINKHWLKSNPDVGIDLIIPNQIQGYDVLKLDRGFFNFLDEFNKSPYNIIKIGKLVLPNSITRIDEPVHQWNGYNPYYVFDEIYIPDSVEYICESGFISLNAKKIRLPENDKYTIIQPKTFADNPYWTEIIIPDNIIKIEEKSFGVFNSIATSIKKIKLSNNLEYIGESAFGGTIDGENEKEGITLDIPESVQKIESYAFIHCRKITDINITSNTKYIGESAFRKTSLKEVRILDGVFYDRGCFSDLFYLKSIIIDNDYNFNFNPNNSIEFIEQPNLKGPFAWFGQNEWGHYGWYLKEFEPEMITAPAILGNNESGWYNGFYWLGITRSSWIKWCQYHNYLGPSIFP